MQYMYIQERIKLYELFDLCALGIYNSRSDVNTVFTHYNNNNNNNNIIIIIVTHARARYLYAICIQSVLL